MGLRAVLRIFAFAFAGAFQTQAQNTLFAAVALLLISSGGALADASGDCRQHEDQDLKIHGCTLIIEGGAEGKKGPAYFSRGDANYAKGDYGRAIADFSEAIRIQPDDAAAFLLRGVSCYAKGDYSCAIADHSEAIRLIPDFTRAYSYRALARLKAGIRKGQTDADKAVALASALPSGIPRDIALISAKATRGLILLVLGDAKAALDDFNEALRLHPDYIEALWGRGQAHELLGDRSLALLDYKRATEVKVWTVYQKIEFQDKARERLSVLETAGAAQIKQAGRGPLRRFNHTAAIRHASQNGAKRLSVAEAEKACLVYPRRASRVPRRQASTLRRRIRSDGPAQPRRARAGICGGLRF